MTVSPGNADTLTAVPSQGVSRTEGQSCCLTPSQDGIGKAIGVSPCVESAQFSHHLARRK
jgi:hypothetical protein